MIRLYLPRPPSVNNAYGGGARRRYRMPKTKAWYEEAGKHVIEQKPKSIDGPVCVTLTVHDEGRGDIDNKIKIVLDLLVKHRLIEGDERKYVRRVVGQWGTVDPRENGYGALVTVEPYP